MKRHEYLQRTSIQKPLKGECKIKRLTKVITHQSNLQTINKV